MGTGPTSWNSKLQSYVATSTAEAEYYALSECTKQVLWYGNIFEELNFTPQKLNIFIDNKSTIYNAENDTINQRSKHIDYKISHGKRFNKERKIRIRIYRIKKII